MTATTARMIDIQHDTTEAPDTARPGMTNGAVRSWLRLEGAAAFIAGLALFGLSLAKIFLYDLSSLSSVARAFSFIFVGGLLLAGGFFLQRLSDRLGPPKQPTSIS